MTTNVKNEEKPESKVEELPEKKVEKVDDKPAPKGEARVGRLVGLFQTQYKTLADRIDALEGKIPAGDLEEEVKREERKEETENIFDEVGRRVSEILGADA